MVIFAVLWLTWSCQCSPQGRAGLCCCSGTQPCPCLGCSHGRWESQEVPCEGSVMVMPSESLPSLGGNRQSCAAAGGWLALGTALWSSGCQCKSSPLSLCLLAPTNTIACVGVSPLWQHCRSPSASILQTEMSRGEMDEELDWGPCRNS